MKEKHFKYLLSDIKLKSENMRKKKLNQAQMHEMPQPTSGHPSFTSPKDSQAELEQILKHKVDGNVVKDFLLNQSSPSADDQLLGKLVKRFKLPTGTKKVKIDLIEEYKKHLLTVSKMPNFSSIKMYMDHCFYKVFMPDEILLN